MAKPTSRIFGCDELHRDGDGCFQRLSAASLRSPEEGLELRPCELDGIELRRIRGREPQSRPCGLDQLADAVGAVGAQLFEHDDVGRSQLWNEEVTSCMEESGRARRISTSQDHSRSPTRGAGPRPEGRAAVLPSARARRTQCPTVATPRFNGSAICRCVSSPCECSATTRCRRSTDYGRPMSIPLLSRRSPVWEHRSRNLAYPVRAVVRGPDTGRVPAGLERAARGPPKRDERRAGA